MYRTDTYCVKARGKIHKEKHDFYLLKYYVASIFYIKKPICTFTFSDNKIKI